MTEFREYSRQFDPEGEHGHNTPRVVFAAIGGALALAAATKFGGNVVEDIVATAAGGGAGALLKNPVETFRANLYYWTCTKLGGDPDPTKLD